MSITWGDLTAETFEIVNGAIKLDGVPRKLLGMRDAFQFPAGGFHLPESQVILNNELNYLQSKGVRLYSMDMGAWNDYGAAPTTVMQMLYDHKMLVIPKFCNKGQPNFDDLLVADFVIGSGTVMSYFQGWLDLMNSWDNVIAIQIENEIDVRGNKNYTLENAIAYIDLMYDYARQNTATPLVMNFGFLDHSPFGTQAQEYFIDYSDIGCFDLYEWNASDFRTKTKTHRDWCKARNKRLWLMEMNKAGTPYDAANLTEEMIDAAFEATHVIFLCGAQNSSLPSSNFFDANGDPIPNLVTLMEHIDKWQEPMLAQTIALDGGLSGQVTFHLTESVQGVHKVFVEDLEGSFEVENFNLSNLQVSPSVVQSGEVVTITIDVTNSGTANHTYEVFLQKQ